MPIRKKLRLIQLVAVIFFTVSGGPYGLEPLLGYAGEHWALILLIITPVLWDVPAILTVLELNSMMPVTGGYYQWVKHALGTRVGFYEGWWTWLYTFVDLAIYPVWFVEYATFFFPWLEAYKMPVYLLIIWGSAGINILGIVPVGKISLFFSVLVLLPFLILVAVAVWHYHGHFSLPAPGLQHHIPSLGMALYTVMWNCLGWDNVTTYAQEVDKPVKTYLKAIAIAFAMVMVVYTAVVIVSLQVGVKADTLNNDGYPVLGQMLAGRWLGSLIAVGGMASTMGIYSAVLLSVSRVPQVMANDNLLPKLLHKLHPKFNTPYVSIIICSVVVSLMMQWSLPELLIIDVTVYGAGLSLEYITLIRLRIKEPDRHRPFKIPLGLKGLVLLIVLPAGIYLFALSGALNSDDGGLKPALFAIGALLTAELAWQIVRRFTFTNTKLS